MAYKHLSSGDYKKNLVCDDIVALLQGIVAGRDDRLAIAAHDARHQQMDLFAAKFVVVTKLALLTHGFVFALFVFCGRVFAHLPGLPPVTLPLFLLRGLLGALAVIAAQLVLAMVIRSFAVPIFLGLLGGITGIFISSKGFGILWPYSLMQLGMNSNKSADALVGSYGLFAFSCIFWLGTMFLLAWLLLKKRDVRA